MIKDKLPERGGYIIEIFAFLIGVLLFAFIVYASWEPMVFATQIKDFQGEGLRVPIYPVWWVIVFGAVQSCYQCISKIVRAVLLFKGKKGVEDLNEEGGIQI
jgi:TRAP-type mannitol/chloroaromatic compound transport system permease small subunit